MRARRLLQSSARQRPLAVLLHGFSGMRLQLLPAASELSARGYDVLNFAYASRSAPLDAHAAALADAVRHRAAGAARVHFVTHSFGGVVLSAALPEIADGEVALGRSALLAPPARGCALARVMAGGGVDEKGVHGIAGGLPEAVRGGVRAAAQLFLGKGGVGEELGRLDEEWWAGREGKHRLLDEKALVIAGNVGEVNPFIRGDSDFVVRVDETVLGVKHFRVEVPMTHNALVVAPSVCRMVGDFLDGGDVGELHIPEKKAGRDS